MKKQSFNEYIRKKITKYFMFIFICLFLFLTILVYFTNIRQINNNLKKETENISQCIADDFSLIEKEIYSIIDQYSYLQNKKELKDDLYSLRASTSLKFNFSILDQNEVITSNLYPKNLELLENSQYLEDSIALINKNEKKTIIEAHTSPYSFGQRSSIFMMEKFDDYYIVFEFLEESLKNINKNKSIPLIITDDFDYVIYKDSQNFENSLGKIFVDPDENITYKIPNNLFNQKIIIMKVKNVRFNKQIIILSYTLISFVSVVFLAFIPFLSRKIALGVSAPLDNFIETINSSKNGKLNHSVNINSFYELELLSKQYNSLINSIQTLFEEQSELRNREKWMEIKILQEQFDPHFLYNTLESIRFEVLLNSDNASKMILSLSNLMRYSIKNHAGTVSLRDDLKYIKGYLTLQKMRFDERLIVEIDLPTAFFDLRVPRLLLQPLIENSIKYNMDNIDVLILKISGKQTDKYNIIEIQDNGIGIKEKVLKNLQNNLREKSHSINNYGLFNVHRSIQLLYGSEYGIEIKNIQKGLKVKIYLPRGENNEKNSLS